MKQHLLKCAALVLALCMMVTMAAGCGGTTDTDTPKDKKTTTTTAVDNNLPEDEDSQQTTKPNQSDNKTNNKTNNKTTKKTESTNVDGTKVNLNGATIKVAGMATCYFALDKNDNAWNKRIREELAAVEKSLNCKFKLTKYDSTKLTEQCLKSDKAGTKFCDVLTTTLWQQKSLMAGKALADLNKVKGVDLTKEYWDQAARKEMQLYGKNFIGFTTLDGTSANANVVFFNKRLAQQALDKIGIKTKNTTEAGNKLYDMVRNNTWTFDQMQKISAKAARDLTGDGKMDDRTAKDQYGFAGVDIRGGVSYSIFKAKGGYFTKTSSNGDVTYALNDAVNITALKTMQTWLLKDSSVFNADKYGNNHEISAEAFAAGRVLFLGWSADSAVEFTTMKDDWGILPYPKADTKSDYVAVISWNTQGFSIPRKVKGNDLTNAALVIDGIAKQFHNIREEKDKYMQARVFRDQDTLKMLELAEKTASIDLVQFCDMGSGGLSSIHYLFDKVSNDPAQRVNSVRDEAVTALNNFLKNVKG